MTKNPLNDQLWTPRSAKDTRALYADWAAAYDADLAQAGYHTPGRVAAALAKYLPDRAAPILDFGCGTGLSGVALRTTGFQTIDGTDITPEMLEKAEHTGAYRHLWVGKPRTLGNRAAGEYAAITAAGVISLGAAPPDTLMMLLDALAPGGFVVFSFNDSTMADPAYTTAHQAVLARAEQLSAEYGPHLDSKNMGSTVYVLRKA